MFRVEENEMQLLEESLRRVIYPFSQLSLNQIHHMSPQFPDRRGSFILPLRYREIQAQEWPYSSRRIQLYQVIRGRCETETDYMIVSTNKHSGRRPVKFPRFSRPSHSLPIFGLEYLIQDFRTSLPKWFGNPFAWVNG